MQPADRRVRPPPVLQRSSSSSVPYFATKRSAAAVFAINSGANERDTTEREAISDEYLVLVTTFSSGQQINEI